VPETTRICKNDGCVEEVTRAGQARYCSDPCRYAAAYAKRKERGTTNDWHKRNADYLREYRKTRIDTWLSSDPEARRAYQRAYSKKNADRLSEQLRARRAAKPGGRSLEHAKVRAKQIAARGEVICASHDCSNRVDLFARSRNALYCSTECQRVEATQRWAEAHKDVIAFNAARYRSENRVQMRDKERARQAKINGNAPARVTQSQLAAKYEMYGNKCWMCGADGPMSLDHVKPISKGGPHILANLRPACMPCNRRKSAHWPWPTTTKLHG
jgi:5-methylcytosine-specific restriction endonuclease McrA